MTHCPVFLLADPFASLTAMSSESVILIFLILAMSLLSIVLRRLNRRAPKRDSDRHG